MKRQSLFSSSIVAFALVLGSVPTARGQMDLHVSLDTSALVGHPAGPFYVDFQLNDGSGAGDANNWASISNFDFGGGSAIASGAGGSGGVGGDLSSGIHLTDSSPLVNEFYEAFNPGSELQFDLHLTTNIDASTVPDIFAFTLLDSDLANIPTLSDGSDLLLAINIDQAQPVVETYASDGTISPFAGGSPLSISAPTIGTPVPEASAVGLVACCLLGMLAIRRRFVK
jgi:hypothetical protein